MNEPQTQPQEAAPDCPHHVVVMYPTKGRFAPPQRYWSCQDCGANFAPAPVDLPRATEGELTVEAGCEHCTCTCVNCAPCGERE